MPIPFNHSRVTDGIIRALRYSSVFSSDNTAQTIRELSNDLTDSEIDAIVATLDYGGGGSGAGVLSSLDDVYVFVDSDGQPATAHVNYLRVTHSMETAPITDPRKMVMSAYYTSGDPSGGQRTEVVVGPDTKVLKAVGTDGTYFEGSLYLGGSRNSGGVVDGYSSFRAGNTVLDGAPGLRIRSKANMDIRANSEINFWYDANVIYNGGDTDLQPVPPVQPFRLGGFIGSSGSLNSTFFIGDYVSGVTDTKALVFTGSNSTQDFDIYLNTEDGDRSIRFITNNPVFAMHVEVNAAHNGTGPYVDRRITDNMNPKFIVYSDEVNGSADDAVAAIRNCMSDYRGTILVLRSSDTNIASTDKSFFFRCEASTGTPGFFNKVFTVSNAGDICTIGDIDANGSVNPGSGCDVAEWIVIPEAVEAAEVIVMDVDGTYKKSTEASDAKVVGVIAEKPGVNLGRDSEVENQYPLTVCGITPVKCTTANGPITFGDLLVSAPDGCAQKSDSPAIPGTIIGKALQVLEQPDVDPVIGSVKTLVILQ